MQAGTAGYVHDKRSHFHFLQNKVSPGDAWGEILIPDLGREWKGAARCFRVITGISSQSLDFDTHYDS
jgi:hypothetical protein